MLCFCRSAEGFFSKSEIFLLASNGFGYPNLIKHLLGYRPKTYNLLFSVYKKHKNIIAFLKNIIRKNYRKWNLLEKRK